MFLKQYNYKPRSASQSSGTDDTATNNTVQASSPTDAANSMQQGRRRSSVTERFSGLHSVKRSSDASADAKKASFLEQKPGQTGILGGMWQNFTKGSS